MVSHFTSSLLNTLPAVVASVKQTVSRLLAAYADRTTEFLRGHLPLGRLPQHEELRDLFQAGLCVDGRRVRLPVADDLYFQLIMQNSEWAHWLQPNSACGATRLAACVTSALLLPNNDPGDEITLASEYSLWRHVRGFVREGFVFTYGFVFRWLCVHR